MDPAEKPPSPDGNLVDTDKSELLPKEFKKPVLLVGPRKGAHKFTKIKQNNDPESAPPEPSMAAPEDTKPAEDSNRQEVARLMVHTGEPAPALKYKEPALSTAPTRKYTLEVLKTGSIVETFNLDNSLFVFGRATNANCVMLHQTVSRHHALLQFGQPEGEETPGFFLYDLNSTHGTYLNKLRIKPHIYVRVQVNHMIQLGMSSRLFILQGPPDDIEPESELSVTELKNLRLKKKLISQLEKQKEEEDNQGIDWGMGEDADEEEDLSVNPFAAAPNEELYIDDPKKTLRGWFEREGCELAYNCEDKGPGQYVCRVELPIENPRGGNIIAEATVRGKKKEAVIQCALEACRILDQHGLLRQATHESKKKKARDWEADDFYDSDEDVFLDRTGTVERKRQKRMQEAGVGQVVHTYPDLVSDHKRIVEEINRVEKALEAAAPPKRDIEVAEDDELDKFMAGLESEGLDKTKVASLKSELARLKQEESRVRKLTNIARPAGTPELLPPWPSENAPVTTKAPVLIGKRPNLQKKHPVKKVQMPPAQQAISKKSEAGNEDAEEFDSD